MEKRNARINNSELWKNNEKLEAIQGAVIQAKWLEHCKANPPYKQ